MEKPFRFIHIPKTGGTSVRKWLRKNEIPCLTSKGHHHAVFFEGEYSFKFCVVRNPYSRLVSFYNFTKIRNNIENHSFEMFVKKNLTKHLDLYPHSLAQTSHILQTMCICRPISENFYKQSIDNCFDWNVCLVDKVFKLENIEELKNFFKTERNFPHEKRSTYDEFMSYYTTDLKELVYNHFKKDFEILEYRK